MLVFESLAPYHNKLAFDCGTLALNFYLQEIANQHIKKNLVKVTVLANKETIIGFYTLSSFSVHMMELSSDIAKKYPPNFSIPSCLIGRLAVDKQF